MKPIIGQRFHAINWWVFDYDLCSNCHENYQGEFRFEPAERGTCLLVRVSSQVVKGGGYMYVMINKPE
jgi:hypothetical protein